MYDYLQKVRARVFFCVVLLFVLFKVMCFTLTGA
jgi:hypothetical protein